MLKLSHNLVNVKQKCSFIIFYFKAVQKLGRRWHARIQISGIDPEEDVQRCRHLRTPDLRVPDRGR